MLWACRFLLQFIPSLTCHAQRLRIFPPSEGKVCDDAGVGARTSNFPLQSKPQLEPMSLRKVPMQWDRGR